MDDMSIEHRAFQRITTASGNIETIGVGQAWNMDQLRMLIKLCKGYREQGHEIKIVKIERTDMDF